MHGSLRRLAVGVCSVTALAVAAPAAAHADVWNELSGTPPAAGAEVKPERFRAFTLDKGELRASLTRAPKGARGAAGSSTVLALPSPAGGIQRFRVYESSIMEPALAARHPEITTYAGRGIDDPTASVVADTSPLGFHASVRSTAGGWYVDPYYRDKQSVYVSYFTRDLADSAAERFVEHDVAGGRAASSAFSAGAVAGPEVELRTFRLALITDPSYANYHGADNVTAAKVTLMNRVDQIYETESAIRMVLIADNDKLNLNTPALATGADGPCGSAPCYTSTNSCGSVLNRNRIVAGQIVGAGAYDIGHIAMGNSGGGVAGLGVVGGNDKARGCTGLATPTGDYFAVDYVSHEMGHQFNGNHTFNGTQSNCGGNRSGEDSVEPGSGSSIMAYAGICQQDNLQPHSDPYWAPHSYEEIQSLVTGERSPIDEVQNASLRGFDGTDSFTIGLLGKTSAPIVRGTNYTEEGIARELQGPSEVQTVALSGYDTDGDSYRLSFGGASGHPIVRGENDTAAGIANSLAGGNERQQVSLTGFNTQTGSLRIAVGGVASELIGAGGRRYSNGNISAAVNAIAGFAGTVSSSGANASGFTLTFGGASAATDVPAIEILDCTCSAATVREAATGGAPLATWPEGATVSAGDVSDAGYALTIGGSVQGTDFEAISLTDGNGADGSVTETVKGAPGMLPAGATTEVEGFGGANTLDDTGFQVTFGGALEEQDVPSMELTFADGATGFVGETAHGGARGNNGFTVTPTGNHAPEVTVPAHFTIPPRTPFALTGSATDADGDAVTYMWEQNDHAGIQATGETAGTALVDQTKTNGPIFRQFGVGADVSLEDSLKYHSPGQNLVDGNPTRVFPDMAQILADDTNAATGQCPAPPPAPQALPVATRECFSEWLPTADWVGFLSDRTLTFRLTARDGRMGGGGVGSAETKVTVAPLAGAFRVTSQAVPQVLYGTTAQTVTWDVAGTDVSPIGVTAVKISLSTDGGLTYPIVLAESTPNDGSFAFQVPDVAADAARIKVEAVGNVFFDVNHGDLKLVKAPTTTVGGTVPPTLSLTLGGPASFGAFAPGVEADYTAQTTANVISSAGEATLSASDPGHLTNGSFALAEPLQVALSKASWDAPVSNDPVTISFSQHIGADEALRTGTYSRTLTFTLSTTTP